MREAIAVAVGLAVGTFGLMDEEGGSTVMDSTLTGDWNAVPLISPPGPATQGEHAWG